MIKGYTDIEQSKKLAEILSPESADMVYAYSYSVNEYTTYPYPLQSSKHFDVYKDDIPCWSLTALLSVLPDEITDNGDVYRNMFFHLKGKYIIQYPRLTTLWPALLSVEADNPIDACVDMIAKVKENNFI